MHIFPFIFTLFFFFFIIITTNISIILGQQPYIGLSTTACPRKGDSKSIRGYTCNGQTHTCQAYLTFRSQPIYSSVSTISSLLGSNPSHLAEINSVSLNETFETNKMVIVPVNCSCSGNYYQANTSYVFQNTDTYFLVANNTFEGLSTCQALMHENHNPADVYPGRKLLVPLRCACPTKNQTEKNIKYLLSYLVNWGDSVSLISEKFGVNFKTTLVANTLTLTHSTIYPFTTLLVPLFDKPKSSQIQTVSVSPHQQPSPSSTSPTTDRKSKKTLVYIVVGVLGGLVVIALTLILCALIFFKKGKKKNDFLVNVSESTSYSAKEKPVKKEEEKLLEIIISGIGQSFKVYDFEEIKVATDDFSPSFLIRGCVYRGVINGDLAVIKITEGDVSKEIQILNKVNHSNVIRLSGVSFNEGHWYLVYEYAANGSLSDWIFSKNKMSDEKFLSWIQRIKIALDVARGVEYLHSFTSHPYIHKDLKCSNVLLDNDFKAKVGSLRLARCVGGLDDDDEQFVATRHIVGTRGYMAPEYLENGIVSAKLDVYAFGVLMLEIITGKEVAAILTEDNENLIDFLSGNEKVKELMDSSLRGNYPFELAMFVVEIIESCLKKDPGNRPAMNEIVSALSRTLNSSLSWEM
ncbi:hypothetical protein RYX36_003700 [Vicia faba]